MLLPKSQLSLDTNWIHTIGKNVCFMDLVRKVELPAWNFLNAIHVPNMLMGKMLDLKALRSSARNRGIHCRLIFDSSQHCVLRGAEGDDCNKISWMPLHALPMHFSVLKDKHKISTGQKETQSSVNDAWQNIRTFPDYLYLNVIKGQNNSQNLCYAAGMSLSQ